MPTYVYRFVDTGETIEIQQAFTDESLTEAVHPGTGELRPVKKVFTPVGVTFKGNGFYKTDSRAATSGRAGAGAAAKDGSGPSSTSSESSGDGAGSSDTSSGSSASTDTASTTSPGGSSAGSSGGSSAGSSDSSARSTN